MARDSQKALSTTAPTPLFDEKRKRPHPHVSNIICTKASKKIGLDFSITLVIYVGIGCGAGWATTYNRQPAILLGLENIAEE